MHAFSLVAALSLASTVLAHTAPHHNGRAQPAAHAPRSWGRREVSSSSAAAEAASTASTSATDSPTATSFASVVPIWFSTGEITISNTQAAAPRETGVARGADRGDTTPLPACGALAAFGGYCDPTTSDCCASGTTCISNVCQRLCGVATVEAYCDSDFPCNASLGYVCTSSRCRPPTGAVHVQVGATCDQGAGNTLFCLPGQAICVSSTCQTCTQHS